MPHQGSWFNLPDYGVTEWIQQKIAPNKAYASTGGSNLIGSGDDGSASSGGSYSDGPMSTAPQMSVDTSTYNRDQVEGASTDQGWGGSGGTGGTGDVPTGDTGFGGQPSGPSQQELMERRMRDSINAGFNDYFGSLDKIAGLLPEQRQTWEGEINNLYGNQRGQIQRSKKNQMQQMDQYETEARQNKAQTLRDMYADMRNLWQAGQNYLGAMGAGDSSAVGRYTTALTKAGNRNATSVMNQANKIMNDINMKRGQIESTVAQELDNLETWKNSKLNDIASWVNTQKQQIQQARANGQLQKADAVNQLNTQIMNQALNRISMLDQEAANFRSGLKQWAIDRSDNLAQLQQNLQGLGQYNMPGYRIDQVSGRMQRAPANVGRGMFGYGTQDEEEQLV